MTQITYLLLSPTFGMHQYTADLANRMAEFGHQVHLVTTSQLPRDRYCSQVQLHTPVHISSTGFSAEGLAWGQIQPVEQALLSTDPQVVHLTGPHLWNMPLMIRLRREGVPVVHTIHDLDPHRGVRNHLLIRLWNRLVIQRADHILVHGRRYQERLIAQGLPPHRITYTPLLHGFWGADKNEGLGVDAASAPPSSASTSASMTAIIGERLPTAVKRSTAIGKHPPVVLFFGRVEVYKGISILLAAWEKMVADRASAGDLQNDAQLLVAGQVAANLSLPSLPPGVELRNRRMSDEEGIDLFQRCSLVVLPYIDATQSALIAAAYFFAKPVIVTRSGALPEYVIEGRTGWIVPPNDVDHLASALRHALADPERMGRMGLAGRLWYEQQRLLEGNTLRAMYSELSLQRS